jgi:hypothetical protein
MCPAERLGESECVVEEAHEIGRGLGLVERAAPSDVAGVGRAQVGQKAPAGGRLRAVGGDEHIRLDQSVPVDVRLHGALAVAEIRERGAPMVAIGRKGSGERAIDRLPRGEVLGRTLGSEAEAICRSSSTSISLRRRISLRLSDFLLDYLSL